MKHVTPPGSPQEGDNTTRLAYLESANYIGQVITLDGQNWRIQAKTGKKLDMFPGGAGVEQFALSLIPGTSPMCRWEKRVWETAFFPEHVTAAPQ